MTPEEQEQIQKYLDHIVAYYKPERLLAVLDYPVPAFNGLSRRQMFEAGLGDYMIPVEDAIASWEHFDLAHFGVTPEILAEVFCETGRPTCARCGHPRDENASWSGHTATGCINGCECQGYRSDDQQEAIEYAQRVLAALRERPLPAEDCTANVEIALECLLEVLS